MTPRKPWLRSLWPAVLATGASLPISICAAEPNNHYQDGLAHVEAGRYQDAIHCFTKAIVADPDNSDLYRARGDAYLNLDQPEHAQADYKLMFHKSYVQKGTGEQKIAAAVETAPNILPIQFPVITVAPSNCPPPPPMVCPPSTLPPIFSPSAPTPSAPSAPVESKPTMDLPTSPTTPSSPSAPSLPSMPSSPTAPSAQPLESPSSQPSSSGNFDLGSGLTAASAGAAASPNMFGDTLGINQNTTRVVDRFTARLGGTFDPVNFADPLLLNPFSNQPINFTDTDALVRVLRFANRLSSRPEDELASRLISPASVTSAISQAQAAAILQANPRASIPLIDNADYRNFVLSVASTRFPGATLQNVASETLGFAALDLVPPESAFEAFAFYTYDVLLVAANVPSPGGGAYVGRTKIAEDNNPMPMDRFIFQYDYFNNATLTAAGINVHRYSLGIEKTFFNRMASVEVRVPFASTLSSEFAVDGVTNSRDTEFGNVNITTKMLLYTDSTVHVTAGAGVALPTADDVKVGMVNGTPLVAIDNQTVVVSPFAAVLLTPGNWFGQFWAAVPFDAKGSPVQANLNFAGLRNIGTLRDATLVQLDAQMGYWLYRQPDYGFLRGLAPFVELHYNGTVSDENPLSQGGFVVGNLNGRTDEVNISAGLSFQLGQNSTVSVGGVAPLKEGADRFFDYQIGVRGSIYYGPTAQARAVNSF